MNLFTIHRLHPNARLGTQPRTGTRRISAATWFAWALLVALPSLALGQSLSVNMPFPAFRTSFITGTEVIIQATATTPPGTTVAKVEFFLNNVKLGEDSIAPYAYAWTIPANQPSYNELKTVVTNSAGATAVQGFSGYNRVDVYRPDHVSTKKYYVKEGADPTNNGLSVGAPFNTIQKAVELVQPGDSVFVLAGTYRNATPGGDVVTIRRTGTPAHWIVLTNYQSEKPKLSFTGYQGFQLNSGSAYLRIQGFEIEGNNANITLAEALQQPGSCEGPNPAATPLARFNGNGISLNGRGGNVRPHHVVLAHNVVHDCPGGGISAIQSDYVAIENNTVYNTSWYTVFGTSGISILNAWNFDNNTTAPRTTIRNNRTYGNQLFVRWNNGGLCKIYDGNGIIVDNNNDKGATRPANPLGAYTGKFLIENNLSYLNGGRGINLNYTDNVTVLNNTTYQNGASDGGPGIGVESEIIMLSSEHARIYNNIFYGRPGEKVDEIRNSPDLLHNHNLTFGGTGTPYFSGNQNQVGVDPQFVDAAGSDFRLNQDSPAVNAGSAVPGQYATKDLFSVDRPQGAGVDIGAYELPGVPVAIARQPANDSAVCAGATVNVSVGVDGPVRAYQWHKDGTPLTGVASATNDTLTLPNVTAADQGRYTVVVTGFNVLTSSPFNLTVNAPPTATLTPSGGTLTCATPSLTLTAGGGSSYAFSGGTPRGTDQVVVSSAGTYSVIVTDANGCTATATAVIEADFSPPASPDVSRLTVPQDTPDARLTVTNCAGTVSWNGVDGAASLPVPTSELGTFAYEVACRVGTCVSPATTVTVTVVPNLSVSHQDGDNHQTANNVIRPNLRLNNEGRSPVAYHTITVRYWLTVENFAPLTNLSVYWAQLGTDKVRVKYVALPLPRQGALGYVEYCFDASAGNLAGNRHSGNIKTGVAKQNWTNLDETDDYSFGARASYTKTDRITVYQNGVLVGGVEPAIITPVTSLKVYSENKNASPTTKQVKTYLRLANEGNGPVDFSQLTVRYWFSAESDQPLIHTIDYAELGNGNVKSKFVREARLGTDTYLELSFVPTLGQFNPLSTTGIIQQRINKSDWSNFNEANDYSYQPAGAPAENTRVTAYLNGALVYGQEPPTQVNARGRVAEKNSGLKVVVLGNPIQGDAVRLEARGAEGQPLRFELIDGRGQLLTEHRVKRAGSSERLLLPLGRTATGVFFLRVSTLKESQTLKLLKQ